MSSNRRHRRPPEPKEFGDPLSDYDPAVYDDDMEQSMTDDPVTVIESNPYCHVTPETPIRDALRLMSEKNIACLVVTENDKPVGILSERDVLNRIAEDYVLLAEQPVSKVMTPDPIVVLETDTPARAMNLMDDGQIRHLPLVDVDGRLIGIIGARRVTAYLQQYFTDVPSG